MKTLFALIFIVAAATACASAPANPKALFKSYQTDLDFYQEIENLEEILNAAEARASDEGRLVLSTGRSMITHQEIILGSCWDYVNAIYDRALFPSKKRAAVFKSKRQGPYADDKLVQPGDWLYYVNHSFGDIEHSGIFVDWLDYEKKEAVILSYAGGRREVPARYKTYIISDIFNIIRPKQ